MEVERKRPMKMFRVVSSFGPYVVGSMIQPTGMYRDILIRRGVIVEVTEPIESAALQPRIAQPEHDRMVRLPEKDEGRPMLSLRKKGAR